MDLNLIHEDNLKKSLISVNDDVFNCALNVPLIHQVVVAFQANGRLGSRAQKTRSEVRGGGAKPWKQKGTGRARAGSIRSPLWRGGGKTFAAKPKCFTQKINKKMYRAAVANILSQLCRENRLLVIDTLSVSKPSTKEFLNKLKNLGFEKGLILVEDFDLNLFLSARNLSQVTLCEQSDINPVSLIDNNQVLITLPLLKKLEEWLQ